ncbi:MAG: NAD(P)H-dependent glycerol-3-phosphate dehydrogenase [Alphaproteobacteria bacterium]
MAQQITRPLSVLGAGAWGKALAAVACRAGAAPLLWDRSGFFCSLLAQQHEKEAQFPGMPLDAFLQATASLEEALAFSDTWLCALPAQSVRSVLMAIRDHLAPEELSRKKLIFASKGIEKNTGFLLHEIARDLCPTLTVAALGGPNLAHEVVQQHPAAATLGGPDLSLGKTLKLFFETPLFQVALSTDLVGVEVGGAFKNVIAIACGYFHGKQTGENAIATLLTHGLAEMVAFGAALGADPLTFLGFSGVGDLVLSCKSLKSRNTAFGVALGQGLSPAQAKEALGGKLVEGAVTAFSVRLRAAQLGVTVPLTTSVCRLLEGEQAFPFPEIRD